VSNRHQRRADLRSFKREASHTLLTYLVEVNDPLNDAPLLQRAACYWCDALPTMLPMRHCIACDACLWDRRHLGGLLLTTPSVRPTSASIVGVCRRSWDDEPLDVIERAAEQVLQAVIPGGRFEPLDTRP
jgi:hypothetical protein